MPLGEQKGGRGTFFPQIICLIHNCRDTFEQVEFCQEVNYYSILYKGNTNERKVSQKKDYIHLQLWLYFFVFHLLNHNPSDSDVQRWWNSVKPRAHTMAKGHHSVFFHSSFSIICSNRNGNASGFFNNSIPCLVFQCYLLNQMSMLTVIIRGGRLGFTCELSSYISRNRPSMAFFCLRKAPSESVFLTSIPK